MNLITDNIQWFFIGLIVLGILSVIGEAVESIRFRRTIDKFFNLFTKTIEREEARDPFRADPKQRPKPRTDRN